MCKYGIPFSLMVGMENDVVTVENSIMVPENITQRIYHIDPAILLLGIHPKD